jgi:hypothetical protein
MKKEDFVWTVGYQGNIAQVNALRKKQWPNSDAMKLLDAGLFRPSFCAALWEAEGNARGLDAWINAFSDKTGIRMSLDEVKRLLGVYSIPGPGVKSKSV